MDVRDRVVPDEWVPDVVLAMLQGVAYDQLSFFELLAGERTGAEVIPARQQAICDFLGILVEQWLFSGKDSGNLDADTPTKRNLTTRMAGVNNNLLEILDHWKDRHRPLLAFSEDGIVSIIYEEPKYDPEHPTSTAVDIAIFWFVRLLSSAGARSLARCANPACKEYFFYLRTPQDTLKTGTFCKNCKSSRSTVQTTAKRDENKLKLVLLAVSFWGSWQSSARMGRDKAEWIARKMNQKLRPSDHKTRKWVVQNTMAIEQHLASVARIAPPSGASKPKPAMKTKR
jgi:hypothetical protein